MSELFNKQLNVEKKFEKQLPAGFVQAPVRPQKVCERNERRNKEKYDVHIKIFLMERRSL